MKEGHSWFLWAGLLQGNNSPGASLSEAAKRGNGSNAYCIPTVCMMTYMLQRIKFSQQSCTIGIIIISTLYRIKLRLREVNGLVQGHATSRW